MEKDCVLCGEEINEKRLKVKPETVYCIECQTKREEKGLFSRSKIEIYQELKSWEVEALHSIIIKGD